MKNPIYKMLITVISGLFLCATLSTAQADFAATNSAFESADVHYQKQELLQTLQSEEVQNKLVEMGVDTGQIEDRVASLTADELNQLNQHLESMPAGSGVAGIVLTVFIVFVITDALCATDIFPFVNCIN
jgi:hypothetical protein